MRKRWLLLAVVVLAAVVFVVVAFARPPSSMTKHGFVCGRQGDVLITVERADDCLGDSVVRAGANVTMAYWPTEGK